MCQYLSTQTYTLIFADLSVATRTKENIQKHSRPHRLESASNCSNKIKVCAVALWLNFKDQTENTIFSFMKIRKLAVRSFKRCMIFRIGFLNNYFT